MLLKKIIITIFQTERNSSLVLRIKIKIPDTRYYAKYFIYIISIYEPGIIIILVSQLHKKRNRALRKLDLCVHYVVKSRFETSRV